MKNEIKLWKKIVACVLATVMLTYAPVEALARSGYNRSNILEGGTQMILRVDDDSDFSEKTESGVIYSHVETDVYSSDGMRVLIEAGTPACIEYTLEPNRSWGQAGRVCLTHATIRTVDNKHIPLRMGSCRKGNSTIGGVIALSVLFFPLGLISGLMKGSMPVIKEGTPFGAYVLQDTEVGEPQQ